jgi:uncharacterized RDD family membrane protein YckC
MVSPPVHGALAPDTRTQPARPRPEGPRELPGLRRRERERSWQDEVRERVRRRKRRRGGEPDLPLFEGPAADDGGGAEVPAPAFGVETALRPIEAGEPPVPALQAPAPPAAADLVAEPPVPTRRAAPAFDQPLLDRAHPPENLVDLPLRPAEAPAPIAEAPAAAPDAEREEGGGEPEDAWSAGAPLEPRLEPPPRPDEERPVERPAQGLERAQAAAVDLVLLGALSTLVAYFARRLAHVPLEGLRPSWPYLGAYLAFLALVYAVYFTGTTGQTLGKLVYGLRVVDTAGRPPGYLLAGGRALLGALGVLTLGLGLLPVLFDPARRAFHDRLLKTRVIRG